MISLILIGWTPIKAPIYGQQISFPTCSFSLLCLLSFFLSFSSFLFIHDFSGFRVELPLVDYTSRSRRTTSLQNSSSQSYNVGWHLVSATHWLEVCSPPLHLVACISVVRCGFPTFLVLNNSSRRQLQEGTHFAEWISLSLWWVTIQSVASNAYFS